MELVRLAPAALAPGTRILRRWAFSPRADWPERRRRLELATRLPGAPRATRVRATALGGVPAEEVSLGALPEAAPAILFLHGGGYAVGSPRTHRTMTALLARGFAGRVVAVDYRLAPEHPHPAALEDAHTVWEALTQTVEPGRVALAGDSAGAGLALALALELRDRGAPPPGAIGLISPWLDVVPEVEGSRRASPGEAILSIGIMRAFAAAYLAGGAGAESPLVSPLRAELRGLAPLHVSTSQHDLLRDDAQAIVRRAREAGVPVRSECLPGLWHDPFTIARLLAGPGAHAPERFGASLRGTLSPPSYSG